MWSLSHMTSIMFTKELQIFKAFANAKRLNIVSLLRKQELNVHELVSFMKYRQSNISQHLMILKNVGIVTSRRDGKNVYYRLSTCTIGEIPDTMIKELDKS